MSTPKSQNFRRWMQLIIMILAAGSIYPLVYLRGAYQETMLYVFNITFEQLNILYVVLGFVFVFGYVPSGILADKFSAKKLIVFSMAGTAAGGFWYATIPGSYIQIVMIFALWGVCSVITFWSAHMKLVKLLTTPETEGRFFGLLDGGRGVVEAALASVAVMIFVARGAEAQAESALVGVILLYAITMAAIAVICAVFLDNDKKLIEAGGKESAEGKFSFSQLGVVFKNRNVLLLGGIIMTGYTMTYAFWFMSGYLQNNVGVGAATAATVMAVGMWMRPIGGTFGGFLCDKLGKTRVMTVIYICTAACLVLLGVLPATLPAAFFMFLVVLTCLFIYGVRGTYWSLLGNCKVEPLVLGTAVGLVSFIGYPGDLVLPLVSNALFRAFGTYGGNTAYFIFTAVVGAVGLLFLTMFAKSTGANKPEK